MSAVNLLPVFMVGLFGSVHCAGMCGGVVTAFSLRPTIPIVSAERALGRTMAYNTGRIGSYAMAGALSATGARALTNLAGVETALYWLANTMLIVLGLYLMDAWRGLAHLENAGRVLWRQLEPLTRRLLPLDSPAKLLAMGALWGWLPCGMVYSVLLTAMMSGSAASGGAVMIAFGLGTLPMLLSLGMLGRTAGMAGSTSCA
ncbi:MAG: sulfite exporter TauE/SafE family protein [Massilia sp.]|nr:sulfite exporter TauE/SafE family protein [Massilia sp.]